ncbi:MAG TPA: hypothetical protein VFL14_10020 [Xanthomonadales bacterium]|nr:hypothetical protein [Xanthomonadales bacterium]
MDMAPTAASARGYAEDAVRNMKSVYNIALDFSLASLAHVDRVLREWREAGAPLEAVTKSLFAFGCYAGEVMRNAEPARWIEPPREQHGQLDDLFLFVRLMNGREWRPIAITVQALTDGPQFNLEQSARQLLAAVH